MKGKPIPCPTCHIFKNPGNELTEGPLSGVEGIWRILIFSCRKHVWAAPVDPSHELRKFGF